MIETRRSEPSFWNPRNAVIFSSPGQSSCFSITHAALASMTRRITPGVITTVSVSG